MPVVLTCGSNASGQLGRVGPTHHFHHVSLDDDLTQVCCGEHHTVVVTNLGAVIGWGRNSEGQLAFPVEEKIVAVPRRLPLHHNELRVMKVAAGQSHTMMLTHDGDVYVVGSGACGQLGNGLCCTCSVTPVRAFINEPVTDISSGPRTCFAITPGGCVYGWGESSTGGLGGGVPLPVVATPMRLQIGPAGTRILRAMSCETYALFVTSSHDVVAIGSNRHGQLVGVDSVEMLPSWKHVRYAQKVRDIACGPTHVVALLQSGRCVESGCTKVSNPSSPTGNGEGGLITFHADPVNIMREGCTGVSAGMGRVFCWSSAGCLYGCGKNHKGQLGCGDQLVATRLQPIPFGVGDERLLQIVGVSCGAGHTAVLLAEDGHQSLASFATMEDEGSEPEDALSGSTRGHRWNEDISNVSFSRARDFHGGGTTQAVAVVSPVAASSALNIVLPPPLTQKVLSHFPPSPSTGSTGNRPLDKSSRQHDAFRNTKILIATTFISVVMLGLGVSIGRKMRSCWGPLASSDVSATLKPE